MVESLPCSNLAGVAAPIIVPELRVGQKKLKGKERKKKKGTKQSIRQNNYLFKGQKREVSQILILGVGKTEVSQTESKRNIKVENYSVSATG